MLNRCNRSRFTCKLGRADFARNGRRRGRRS